MTNLKNEDRRFIYGMLSPTVFVFLAGIAFPLIYGVYLSFFYTDTLRHIDTFVGIGNYRDLLQGSLAVNFYRVYYNTVFFTVVTVTFELIFGLAIALLINKEFKGRGIMRAAVLVPWAMPTIVNAQLWSYMFRGDNFGLVNSFLFTIGFIPKGGQGLLFATESSFIYVNYIYLFGLLVLPIFLFILLYNLGRGLYYHNTNDFIKSRVFVISVIMIVIGLIFGYLLPSFYGLDKSYGYSGDTLLANNLIPLSLTYFLLIIFGLLFILFVLKAFLDLRKEGEPLNLNTIRNNNAFIKTIIIAVILLAIGLFFPFQFGNSFPINITTKYPTAMFVVLIVDIWKTTPFMALLILASLQVIPQDLYKAASVDGATSYQQFRQITLPLIVPGIGTALIFRCIDAFRVYDILAVFSIKSIQSISIFAYQQQNVSYHDGTASAIAVITFINIIIFTVVFFYLTRRRDEL